MRTGPGVNAAAVGFGDLGIAPRLGLQLDLAVLGDIELQLLVEHGAVVVEVVLHPELPRSQRGLGHRHKVIFQFFSRTQARHGHVLLPVVGVNRSFFFQRDAQVLNRIRRGRHAGAIGLQRPHKGNFDPLVGGVVSPDQLSPLLDAGFALHFNARVDFPPPGAVIFEAKRSPQLLDNVGFLGMVRRLGWRQRNRWRRSIWRLGEKREWKKTA